MTAQDRARVVEHWIQVAQECEILKNFSSLRAVISALQKTSISHLKNTWADVSRESSEQLKEFCSHDKSLRRELMTKGVVPYLGTFLGDLLMLHLAMGDYLEGSEINLQKRTEEYRVMREMLLLQVAAKNYNLEPEERFGAWFQDMELLNENDRRRFVMQLLRLHLGLLPSCLCCLHTRLSSIPARTYVMLFQEEMSWRPQPLSGHEMT
ncbi:ral guanine nucleotide dissociation stimulator-like isoform X4 [Diceros bicornis minor]|uniref:ral guanine nucleotide dissociation stimulator-like isoform X4 n=1 Tax=Diceros bicornis minor TaxID=77932 RepID=UPI0026F093E5|nr:ral guanine nucleotide dissociation stimulator-like isoform X4 [Diceros bicornis minor]